MCSYLAYFTVKIIRSMRYVHIQNRNVIVTAHTHIHAFCNIQLQLKWLRMLSTWIFWVQFQYYFLNIFPRWNFTCSPRNKHSNIPMKFHPSWTREYVCAPIYAKNSLEGVFMKCFIYKNNNIIEIHEKLQQFTIIFVVVTMYCVLFLRKAELIWFAKAMADDVRTQQEKTKFFYYIFTENHIILIRYYVVALHWKFVLYVLWCTEAILNSL